MQIYVVHTPARDEVQFLCGPCLRAALRLNNHLQVVPAQFRKHCDVCDIQHPG